MRSRFLPRILRGGALLFPVIAHAHPGHEGSSGFNAGFSHPFCGVDHLLAVTAIALWAAQLGGRARWIVPASFLAALTAGAVSASWGHPLPFASTMILVSLLAAGVCLFGMVRVPLALAGAAAGAFALFHGSAHAATAPGAAWPFDAGFLLATAILQAAGLAVGHYIRTQPAVVLRFCGGVLALGGVGLLLS